MLLVDTRYMSRLVRTEPSTDTSAQLVIPRYTKLSMSSSETMVCGEHGNEAVKEHGVVDCACPVSARKLPESPSQVMTNKDLDRPDISLEG